MMTFQDHELPLCNPIATSNSTVMNFYTQMVNKTGLPSAGLQGTR
jgi:hypothetical protein